MTAHIYRTMLVVVLLAPLTAPGQSNAGSHAAPKTAEAAPSVDVPQSATRDETTPDPATQALVRAWTDYQQTVTAALKASADPRDWAVAGAALMVDTRSSAPRAESVALLRRAAKATSEDAIAQWLVLSGARRTESSDLADQTVDVLARIESDNAAVWMEMLQRAAMRHDRAGVTAALKRMSTASRVDNHFAEIVKMIADSFARVPMPDDLTDPVTNGMKVSREMMPFIYATAMTSAYALPGYQFLSTACRWDTSGRNADRALDCQRVGRLMSQQSDTLLGRNIGFAVLRTSHTFDDEDIKAARESDWVFEKFAEVSMANTQSTVDSSEQRKELSAYQKDWMDTGSEMEAARRRLVRAGYPATPPESWIERSPRFSAERVQQDDANAAEKVANAGY